ncbi:peptidase C14, caspase domain-containing protein [Rhizoctonia solani]|nr:peptidase C14, caspase domain-containing protein [Rhizoctonia solani]
MGDLDLPINIQLPSGSPSAHIPAFTQVSNCTGTKKALCVGINYRGMELELQGCVNDANNIAEFLTHQFGFQMDNILKLTDDVSDPERLPTKANIISAMRWLVEGAKPDDSLFFHYSGHGGQTEDLEGDEIDGYDEGMTSFSSEITRQAYDFAFPFEMMHDLIVRPLPPGCRLTALFDCSHSGTTWVKPTLICPYFPFKDRGKVKEPSRWVDVGQGLLDAGRSSMHGDVKGMFKGFGSMFKSETHLQKKAARYAKKTRASPADIVAWAGCKDFEKSGDVMDDGKSIGAMSYAFTEALRRQPRQSYQELLNNIRDLLHGKHDQKPQLTSSHPIVRTISY